MLEKIYIIPEANSYVTSVIPTIYGAKEFTKDDIVGKDSIYKYPSVEVFVKDVFKDNNRVFAIIDGKYYRLDIHNYNLPLDEIKASCTVSFTEDQIKEITNGTFCNYVETPKEEPPIVEIPDEDDDITDTPGTDSGNTDTETTPDTDAGNTPGTGDNNGDTSTEETPDNSGTEGEDNSSTDTPEGTSPEVGGTEEPATGTYNTPRNNKNNRKNK